MASSQRKRLVITGLRGRDGSTTSPLEIPPGKALECLNVDLYRTSGARKRGGADDVFASTTSEESASIIAALARHVPGADETLAEFWKLSSAATPILQRLAGGTAWASITLKDAVSTRPQDAIFITFNGKLYILSDTAVDRPQVFDPAISTTTLRRAGLAAPTGFDSGDIANTGSGSYAATQRYYRIRYTVQVSSSTVLRSEPSEEVAFTPSGSGTAARITKPATISEGETHWEVEVATSSEGPWFLLSTTAVGTTTYDDSASVSSYSGGDARSTGDFEAGEFTTPKSFKYGIADGARLLFGGTWESALDPSTVYFTPVRGTISAAYYDEERIPSANALPLDPRDGGVLTGFGGPFDRGKVIAFKYRATYMLRPTGVNDDPYRTEVISKSIGCVRQQSVVVAEDEAGRPTVYWLSHLGPYRWNPQGLANLVWDVKDIWDTVNLDATTVSCHGVYHSDLHQIWWWVATGSNNEPDTKIVFDTRLGRIVEAGHVVDGWTKHTGSSASARCSCMFSDTLGASMSRDLKPHIGQHGGNGRLWKCDTTASDDVGNTFQAYCDFPDQYLGGPDLNCQTDTAYIIGTVGSWSLRVTLRGDYGLQSRTADVSMAATASETRTRRKLEDSAMADGASAISVRVGDASAIASGQWIWDAVIVPFEAREIG